MDKLRKSILILELSAFPYTLPSSTFGYIANKLQGRIRKLCFFPQKYLTVCKTIIAKMC